MREYYVQQRFVANVQVDIQLSWNLACLQNIAEDGSCTSENGYSHDISSVKLLRAETDADSKVFQCKRCLRPVVYL